MPIYTIVSVTAICCYIRHVELRRTLAAIAQIESDLHASSSDISWSISLYILLLGDVPLIWSAFSELYGRKVSVLLYVLPFLSPHLVTYALENLHCFIRPWAHWLHRSGSRQVGGSPHRYAVRSGSRVRKQFGV